MIRAGKIEAGCDEYRRVVLKLIRDNVMEEFILRRICYIADKEVEVFFKASDVLALPYRIIF